MIRHPIAAPAAVAACHLRLRAALDSDGPVERHTAALCALVRTAGLERRLFPDRPLRDVRRRLDRIGIRHAIIDAVRAAIREVRVATLAGATGGSA